MSRRRVTIAARTEQQRAAEAAAADSAPPAMDWPLEIKRAMAENARLQLRVADLELKLAKAEAAQPKPAKPVSKLEALERRAAAAKSIADAADKGLALALAQNMAKSEAKSTTVRRRKDVKSTKASPRAPGDRKAVRRRT